MRILDIRYSAFPEILGTYIAQERTCEPGHAAAQRHLARTIS
jgi:hypothetical protein